MKKYFFIILVSATYACSNNTVSIKEVLETFVTYPFSDPDAIPQPDRKYYPYYRFDGFANDPDSAEWKVVTMENEYIEVHVFPEIGGKIWGAIEKSTGNEFIYYNSVVKFRDIALRGPWTSGGVELNFGVKGHTPSVSTPVDYSIKNNDDGSVSCFVGTIDLLTRTWWETEINLHPDNAYFTTNTRWRNSTPFLQPYYQWSNAAYQTEGDLEMIFPGTHQISHGGEAYRWPIDDNNRDLSFYGNNDFGGNKSYHIIGGPHSFYAAYWHGLNFGAGHYSRYGDKLGKKVWIWSHARSGGIWEDLLTDSDGQYVELQSGRLFNQASTSSAQTPFKHYGFFPYTFDEFKEYWYPIMNIGGVVAANPKGVLNVIKGDDDQKLYLSPIQPIKDEIKIFFGDELKYNFDLDLKSLEVWEINIPINPKHKPLEVFVGSRKELLYSERKENLISGRPVKSPEGFDWSSVFGLYTEGINWLYQNRFDLAYESFKACLNKDPLYAPALNHISELYIRKTDFDNAMIHVKKSLAINAYDAKANFLFGLINRKEGNLFDAEDGFAVASVSPDYRIASYLELTKLFILKDELYTAQKYARRVFENNPNNQDALLLLAIISRKTNANKMAGVYLEQLESLSPLNHFSRFERMLLKENRRTTDNFTSMIRNELPNETYIEMALWYEYLGYNNEAIKLLELSPPTALTNLRLSYLHKLNDDSEKSDSLFNKAMQDSPDFVLPFRSEFVPVLEWAVNRSDDWKPIYYLGLLNWSIGNKQVAIDLFSNCGQNPESPYFYLAKTDLYREEPDYDPEVDFLRALELDLHEWRTYLALIDHYLATNAAAKALEISEKSLELKNYSSNYTLQYAYAKCLLANGSYSASLNELENTVILPHENARYGRVTYWQAAIMESLQYIKDNRFDQALSSIEKARLWPENLGVGRPYDVDDRIADFLEAKSLMYIGEKEKAHDLYHEIITYRKGREVKYNSTDLLHLVVLKRLGMNHQAENFLIQWQKSSPNDLVLRWGSAMINDNRSAARVLEQEIDEEFEGMRWDPRRADPEFEVIKEISNHINFNFR